MLTLALVLATVNDLSNTVTYHARVVPHPFQRLCASLRESTTIEIRPGGEKPREDEGGGENGKVEQSIAESTPHPKP